MHSTWVFDVSVQRIDSKRTHGWQARAYVEPNGMQRLTRFFSDRANGGKRAAHRKAKAAEPALKRKARELRASRRGGR
jgi:hypothetical protein